MGQQMLPDYYRITGKDIIISIASRLSVGRDHIYYEKSMTLAHMTAAREIYYKLSSALLPAEQSFFQKMEQQFLDQWDMIGHWRSRSCGKVTYLLVFNHKSQDASMPQRLIIAWFEITGTGGGHRLPFIERHIELDTKGTRYKDTLIKFLILEREEESNARSSARSSDSEESLETPISRAISPITTPKNPPIVDRVVLPRRARSTGDLYNYKGGQF